MFNSKNSLKYSKKLEHNTSDIIFLSVNYFNQILEKAPLNVIKYQRDFITGKVHN